jgi:hypothetical protein
MHRIVLGQRHPDAVLTQPGANRRRAHDATTSGRPRSPARPKVEENNLEAEARFSLDAEAASLERSSEKAALQPTLECYYVVTKGSAMRAWCS